MEDSIIFIIGDRPTEINGFFVHLGHELFGARSLIFDLLSKNIITEEQTTILTMLDRMFLYNNIFKKTKSHEKDKIDLKTYKHIINLNELVKNPRGDNIHYFHNTTNNIFEGLYEPIGFNNYKNSTFKEYVIQCNCDVLEPFNSEFIILHYRNYKNKINIWNQSTNEKTTELILLLKNIKKHFTNILIFGNLDTDIKIEGLNIKICTNLKDYVSYMKSENCKLIISQWSGAGQLGQLFFNKQILYYFGNGDQIPYSEMLFSNPDNYYNFLNSSYSWDYQTFSKCKRYWFKNINHLINFFNKNYYEKLDENINEIKDLDHWYKH